MASMAMTACFLPLATKHPSSAVGRRTLIVAKATEDAAKPKMENNSQSQGRRFLVAGGGYAVAAAAVAAAKVAMADEPKSGTAEAKQKYAPICVTMPTARVCHK